MNLFVYGTLLDADVMRLVCGQTFPGTSAQLEGFRCRKIAGELFPAIVPAAGEQVVGKLYSNLSAGALKTLDGYEGELYQRWRVTVSVAAGRIGAETYVLKEQYRHLLSCQMWSLDDFSGRAKADFLKGLK